MLAEVPFSDDRLKAFLFKTFNNSKRVALIRCLCIVRITYQISGNCACARGFVPTQPSKNSKRTGP